MLHFVSHPKSTLQPPSWDSLIEPTRKFFIFAVFQLINLVILPGKDFNGPVSPSGFTPRYKDNGLLHFFVTLFTYCVLVHHFKLIPLGYIYTHLTEIIFLFNVLSLFTCTILWYKGLYHPSTGDSGSSGNTFLDYYWGTELYPSFFGISFKQYWICRLGMVLWMYFAISFAEMTWKNHGTSLGYGQYASVALQVCYIAKFFYWERWYLHAADIAVDRMGFMLTWGTLCFMPLVHTLENLYLVNHSGLALSLPASILLFVWGTCCTWMNYDSDTQRHRVRQSNGKCLVWGKPPRTIKAKYRTTDGKERENLLLCSGWNGCSRHFHYLPDIFNLINYCLPTGFSRILPWMYCIYLTALLIDRTWRIDEKCLLKYGNYYKEYMKIVPFRLIPGVW